MVKMFLFTPLMIVFAELVIMYLALRIKVYRI